MRDGLKYGLRAVRLALGATALAAAVLPGAASAATFTYTGDAQTWVVPDGVTRVQADLYGADGGNFASVFSGVQKGGDGGSVHALLQVAPGETLTVYVGGKGVRAGGFNGGGPAGGTNPWPNGGGGASDVRRGGTKLLVAGGGGGAAPFAGGGDAGRDGQDAGLSSNGGEAARGSGGAGGTPTSSGCGSPGSPGSLGQGGAGGAAAYDDSIDPGAGGGGGYYGGGGGAGDICALSGGGGGGGSSFVSPTASVTGSPAPGSPVPDEHGLVVLTPLVENASCPPGQAGTPPACVAPPVGVPGSYSGSCADPTAKVVDGFAGSVYVLLRVQQNPANAQESWVCYRAWNAAGSVDLGGRVDLDHGVAGGTTPTTDPSSAGCSIVPVNAEVGPDSTPVKVGVNSTSTAARACFRVGSFEQGVTVPVSGAAGRIPQVNPDRPGEGHIGVPPPADPLPSGTCQRTAGHTRLADIDAGGTRIRAYSAPGGPGETRLCVRAEGPVGHGGVLTVKSSTGVAPVVQGPVPDTSPSSCGTHVLTNNAEPRFTIRVGVSNPASICLSVGTSGQFGAPGQRYTLGTSGSPSSPMTWTPDPGTPG